MSGNESPADEADRLYALGNQLRASGRHLESLTAYDRALALRPDFPEVLNNRGNALKELKRYDEALSSYDRALALNPEHRRAHNNRGNVLRDLKRYDEALLSYDRALAGKADYVEAHVNRGNVLRDLKRYEEALLSYDRALELRPVLLSALNNRGLALLDLERPLEALENYDRALALYPQDSELHYHRALNLMALKRPEEALAAFERALNIAPDNADAWNELGNALLFLRHAVGALRSYDRAAMLRPDDAGILCNRGRAREALGRVGAALLDYTRACEIKPDYADALHARAQALRELKRNGEAIACAERLAEIEPGYGLGTLVDLKRSACDWSGLETQEAALVAAAREGKRATDPFFFLAVSDSPKDQLRCAEAFFGVRSPFAPAKLWNGERYRHKKIRLAYLSADFREHPGAYLMAGLFETHDRSRFETTAISWGPSNPSPIRSRLIGAFDRFLDVDPASDREVAQKLRELEIDIAINRMGYTRQARTGIVSMRPAPVQVSFLGYPGTMAADFIDYLIADRIVIPEDEEQYYREKIVTLPDSYQCNDSKPKVAETTPTRAEAGLPEQGFVFCSFNNSYKITPPVFDVWMDLLRRVPESVLWLLADNATATANLRREAEARGVDQARLVFAPRLSHDLHLARHRLADLFLDTLPYNAHTTASDSLSMDVPLVTCTGTTFAGRVATSLLNAIGLPELATRSLEEYRSLALNLAQAPDSLRAVKAKLAANRSTHPLFDTARFCRNLEAAYMTMWERAERGEPPAPFAIAKD
ncbi:MAG TPA: tetratricopeptide repeat protein [Micropepsaceae bacterium]|nr:tetratricopeptide repeat protein [Micropepsaceae bacterium]